MTNPVEICVSVGSNARDAMEKVREALDFLNHFMCDVRTSSIYTTPAVNGDGSVYHNAVASGIIDIPVEEVAFIFKEWESACGRIHDAEHKGCVAIDLDIVMARGEVIRQKDFSREYFQHGFRELDLPDAER